GHSATADAVIWQSHHRGRNYLNRSGNCGAMNRVSILATNSAAARFEPFSSGDTLFAFDLLTGTGPRRLIEGQVWAYVDWVMDDLSGLEMCRRLRADTRMRDAHVTIVLERDDSDDR